MYHQTERRNKIRNLWLWLVCCSLLPTCYFHRPSTLLLVFLKVLSANRATLPEFEKGVLWNLVVGHRFAEGVDPVKQKLAYLGKGLQEEVI